jgi:hypothetical protein
MTHLGDFGTERDVVEAEFGYFGATIRVNPDITDVGVLEVFAALGEMSEDSEAVLVMSELRSAVATMVHPDDIERFWELAHRNRQTSEDIGSLASKLIEGLAGRPTKQPSDSSGGLPTTDTSSPAASSSPALRALAGRPDLQLAVVRAEEARQAV